MKYIIMMVVALSLAACAEKEAEVIVPAPEVTEEEVSQSAQMDITVPVEEEMVQMTEAIDAEAVAKEFADEEVLREVERAQAIEEAIKQ